MGNPLTSLNGESTVINNMATAIIRTNPDGRTEGLETFTFSVGNNSSNVTINHSTGTEVYTVTTVDTQNNEITEVNEGDTAIVSLRTQNVSDNTVVNYSVTGIDSDDLDEGSDPLMGTVTITNDGMGVSSSVIGKSGSSFFNRDIVYAFYDDGVTDTSIENILGTGVETGSIRLNNSGPWLPFDDIRLASSSNLTGLGDIRFDLITSLLPPGN